MRFKGFALAMSAFVLGACAGKDNKAADSAAATTTTDTAAAATAAPAPTTAATPAPASGNVVEVKMIGDAQGYRFEPADVKIKAGDTVKWTMVSGGPHNVAFDPAAVAAAKAQIAAAMPNQQGELSSPMLTQPNEVYQATFANVPAGKYDYHCTPHLAMGMKGSITVE